MTHFKINKISFLEYFPSTSPKMFSVCLLLLQQGAVLSATYNKG